MKIHKLHREQFLARPLDEVFAFFSCAENLEEITPEFLNFRILSVHPPEIRLGTVIRYRLAWHRLIPLRWTTEIIRWEPPARFVDSQVSGPYKLWHHEHRFEARGNGTMMFDTVRYALPLSGLGVMAHRFVVRRDVSKIFDFRAQRISELFAAV